MRGAARAIFLGASWLLVAGLVVQIFLAGLGVFESSTRFATHRDFGFLLEILPLILVVAGLVGGVGRRWVGLAALIFALFLVQSLLVGIRGQAPVVAALHPVNGFIITLLAVLVAREATVARTRREADAP
jgi:hypothetical protein